MWMLQLELPITMELYIRLRHLGFCASILCWIYQKPSFQRKKVVRTDKFNYKILIACEESQTECTAFRNAGFEAYSCDVSEPSGGHPEWHIQTDCTSLIGGA